MIPNYNKTNSAPERRRRRRCFPSAGRGSAGTAEPPLSWSRADRALRGQGTGVGPTGEHLRRQEGQTAPLGLTRRKLTRPSCSRPRSFTPARLCPAPRAWLEGQRRLIGGCAQGVACVTWMGEYAPFRWREGVARRRGDVRERREAAPGRALVVPRSLSRCAPAPLPPRPRYGSTARRCVPPARRRLRRCRGRTGAGGAACRGSLGPAGPQPPPAD